MNDNYLARARRASGLTQKKLGQLVGVGSSTISLYEIEEVFPSVPRLYAHALSIEIKHFEDGFFVGCLVEADFSDFF